MVSGWLDWSVTFSDGGVITGSGMGSISTGGGGLLGVSEVGCCELPGVGGVGGCRIPEFSGLGGCELPGVGGAEEYWFTLFWGVARLLLGALASFSSTALDNGGRDSIIDS